MTAGEKEREAILLLLRHARTAVVHLEVPDAETGNIAAVALPLIDVLGAFGIDSTRLCLNMHGPRRICAG